MGTRREEARVDAADFGGGPGAVAAGEHRGRPAQGDWEPLLFRAAGAAAGGRCPSGAVPVPEFH